MGDTETNFAHLHDNGELFVASNLEAARGMCPVLGKLSLEEAGLLLELEAMGNAILAAQQGTQPKTKITTETVKPETGKFLAAKDMAERELPAIKAFTHSEATASHTPTQTAEEKHPAALAEQSEHENQEHETSPSAIHSLLQKAEALRRQNLLEVIADTESTSSATKIELAQPTVQRPIATQENSVSPTGAEQPKTKPDKPPAAKSHIDNLETGFTRPEVVNGAPQIEITETAQPFEEILPELTAKTADDEDVQPALHMISFTPETLPAPIPGEAPEVTPEASTLTPIILPSELAEQLEVLEPSEVIGAHELLNELAQATEILRQPHPAATPEEVVQAEEQAEEALMNLAKHVGITYSNSKAKAYVKQMLAELTTTPHQEMSDINYALSHYGTHEGLQQFTLSLKQFRKVAGSLHAVLGKFALFLSTLYPIDQTESY